MKEKKSIRDEEIATNPYEMSSINRKPKRLFFIIISINQSY